MYTNENLSGISGYVCKYDWENDTSYRDSWDEWRDSIRQEDEDRWRDNHWNIINDDIDSFWDERRQKRIYEDEENYSNYRRDDDNPRHDIDDSDIDSYWDNNE